MAHATDKLDPNTPASRRGEAPSVQTRVRQMPALSFASHPDRAAALGEAHARPSMPIYVPSTIHHLAFASTTREATEALFGAVLGTERLGSARHTIIVRDGLTVKLEPHTEFATLTLVSGGGGIAGEALLAEISGAMPRDTPLLVALRVLVVAKAAVEAHPHDIGGVMRGGIDVSSSFRIGPDGFMEMRLGAPDMGAEQFGRRVQRVLETETYRTMALLGLPVARRIGPELNALEDELSAATAALTASTGTDEEILDRLQTLSARTEAMRASTRFRFSATRAYAALVDERIATLAEEKVGERPTLSAFIQTRLAPAVRTVLSTEARMTALSAAVGRALDLLRTRVDVSMNRGNQEILRSMNERQHRQLILSEAVESLSVIAISYYLLGLLAYPVKGLKELHLLPVTETIALAVLAPVVAFAVWSALRRLRGRWID